MQTTDLHYPFAGLDVSSAYCKQPNRPAVHGQYARTSAQAINVRSFDATDHARGGSRTGISKYIEAIPGGTQYIIQDLEMLVNTGISVPGGGTVQSSESGRVVLLVAVVAGDVYTCPAGGTVWTIATNSTGETPPLSITGLMQSASNNQKLYFADGTNKVYYDPSTNTLFPWTLTDGDFPVDSQGNTPRLICTWHGRTVMSGLPYDQSAIFMSKVSDPTNFQYNPALPVPPDSAWSGHTGPQGLMGDVVTALIPYTDDVLIVGMDSSLAIFRGDPQYGGSIDNVTTTIGIAWGKAWCMDPTGTVYFFSNRIGIFAFVPGNQPQRISAPIDSLLLNVDTGINTILLQWNDRFQQLHVWITLTSTPAPTTHYVWESRSNAWWQDQFVDANKNPLTCVTFDGNTAADRVALIGSWDGYVRSISSDATDDDGDPINSEIFIGPFLTQYNDSVMLKEIQGVLGANSGDVNYEVYIGDSAEEALSSTPVASGTWGAGRNFTDTIRRAGYACYIRLLSSNAFAMESIRAILDANGAIRRRGK